MRIARIALDDQVAYGVVEGSVEGDPDGWDAEVALIKAHPFAPIEFTGQRVPLRRARLLAPVLPSKVRARWPARCRPIR